MALNPTLLGTQLASAVAGLSDADKQNLVVIWTKIAEQLVTHIKTNAVVNTTGSATAQIGTIT